MKTIKSQNKPPRPATRSIAGRKIAILGLGIENYALVKYLLNVETRRGASLRWDITVCDARSAEELRERYKELVKHKNIKWKLGKYYKKKLREFDVLFRSPGWPTPPHLPLKGGRRGVFSSPMKLFFELCPTKNIIGVTGTKGKGTTASLVYEILRKAGKRVWLGGNIGTAPFDFLSKIKKNDWVVLELSSFQLENMDVSPHIAVTTNFYKEHLAPADPNNPNYHKTLKDYWKAKLNIVKWQNKNDFAIINKNLELRIKNYELRGKKFYFGGLNKKANCYFVEPKVVKIHNSKFIIHTSLIGEHNKENIAAAVQVAKIVGVKDDIIKRAVANFKGLEHRLEFVGIRRVATNGAHSNVSKEGVKYYNDSFATTPESAIIALKSFSAPIILLAGGAEKRADFKEFAKWVKKKTKFAVLLNGKATPRIKKELLKINYPASKMKLVKSIKEAVKAARHIAKAGDVVLLSPACASFGMFKNYKERGRLFKEEVKNFPPNTRGGVRGGGMRSEKNFEFGILNFEWE